MDRASDLVMYWWDRAADILTRKSSKLRRFGLVTTNSITQVFQRRTLTRWMSDASPNKQPLSLVFAIDDHPWTKATRNAAAVRIAMTVAQARKHDGVLARVVQESGLDTDQPNIAVEERRGHINADLTIGTDVSSAKGLLGNRGLCINGMKPLGAGFIVTELEARHLGLGRREGLDAHVRPYRNGRDLTGRPRNIYAIDFWGLTADQVRERFPEAYQHLSLTVKPEREAAARISTTADAREYAARWWTFCKPRQELRASSKGLSRQIVAVQTAKHRVFQFLPIELMPDQKLIVVSLEDAAYLSVLNSKPHLIWSEKTSSWLGVGNDAVYVKVKSFDPFPFPSFTETQHAALVDAGERLDAFCKARLAENSKLTLTRLYNALAAHRAQRPMTPQEAEDFERGSVLVLAELHDEIDALTLDAYGWPRDLAAEDLLARLVALNAERAAEEARGYVRWLRPDYQIPRFAKKTAAGPAQAADLIGDLPSASAQTAKWPPDARTQVLLIKGALAEAGALKPEALAARFAGRKVTSDVPRLLGALQRDGQVRRGADGGYTLLRAA